MFSPDSLLPVPSCPIKFSMITTLNLNETRLHVQFQLGSFPQTLAFRRKKKPFHCRHFSPILTIGAQIQNIETFLVDDTSILTIMPPRKKVTALPPVEFACKRCINFRVHKGGRYEYQNLGNSCIRIPANGPRCTRCRDSHVLCEVSQQGLASPPFTSPLFRVQLMLSSLQHMDPMMNSGLVFKRLLMNVGS